jgi:hypothetical protein
MVHEVVSDRTTVLQTGNQVATDLADEVVILNLASGVYYGLEGVGARIWRLIREPVAMEAVVEAILSEYDVDREACRRDVQELLERLAAEGLVEVRNAGAPQI